MPSSYRLHTRAARKKLQPREEPYYHELRRGLRLGYRRGKTGGSWLLRESRGDHFVKRRLGLADDDAPSDGASVLTFEEAQAIALGADRPTLTKPGKYTVAEAAEAYFELKSREHDAANIERDRVTYAATIAGERKGVPKLGDRPVAELTTDELRRWLAALVPQTDDRDERRRAQATANRHWNLLRAILNFAYEGERVPSADAWARVKPYKDVDRARKRNLTADEAGELLGELQSPLRELAHASLFSGLRFGELAALRVRDVAGDSVHIEHSKSGKARHVPLTADGVEFFAQLCQGKAADALVFEALSKIQVSRGMRAACVAAKIPAATFHDLRRSYGSLLLNAGAPLSTISRLLGHADMRMTLRNYAHLADSELRSAVDQHLPSFKPTRKKKPR